ncbi:MAG: hypothetical protein ACREDC_01950 [Bradyrhizobium sp.]
MTERERIGVAIHDEAFQLACQRYAHKNGSSDGIMTAAIRAYLAAAYPRDEWQDIASAPRDGTDFLALMEYKRKHHQMVGCFAPDRFFHSWPGRFKYHPVAWRPLPALSNNPGMEEMA